MSKESFCKVMDDYKSMWNFTDDLNDLFRKYKSVRKYKSDGEVYPPMCTETVIDLLEFIFNDKNQWIKYWIWELGFGADYQDGDVQNPDGTIVPLKTVGDLYDLLVGNMKENGGE